MSERRKAYDLGETTYTALHKCKRGHIPIRYTSTGVCVECNKIRAQFNRRSYRAAKLGYRKHVILIHDSDLDAVTKYAKTLEMARRLQNGEIQK